MYSLTIYLDTDDADTADQARTEIAAALGMRNIGVPYGVDDDGPVKVDGYDGTT